jgi:hypothetical protein
VVCRQETEGQIVKKRGKILRDLSLGRGLLILEGRQYPFSLEAWISESRPAPGRAVEVDFDARGQLRTVRPVSDIQLAKEQSARVLSRNPVVQPHFWVQPDVIQIIGLAFLVASGLFVTAVSIQTPFQEKLNFSLWQMLGSLPAGGYSNLLSGSVPVINGYQTAVIAGLCATLLSTFWKNRCARLSGFIPVTVVMIVAFEFLRSLPGLEGVALRPGIYLSTAIVLLMAANSVYGFHATNRRAVRPSSINKKAA